MQKLYHGTLARNLPSIRVHGLLPQKGSWTATFYKDAPDLVYAVDEERKGRLLAIITGQLARAGLVNLSDTYTFDDFKNDLAAHGAVIEFAAESFSCYETFSELTHPPSVEQGDWYSSEPVSADRIEQIVTGQEMVEWLKPHPVDFSCRYREILERGGPRPTMSTDNPSAPPLSSAGKRMRTQWATQFLVASELVRRDYTVSFTMGNHTPNADLMVGTPSGTGCRNAT